MSKRCSAKNRNGKQCGAWSAAGKGKCALHLESSIGGENGLEAWIQKGTPASLRRTAYGTAEDGWRRPRRLTPMRIIVPDLLVCFILAVAAWIMSKIEGRRLGQYGLPRSEALRKNFW